MKTRAIISCVYLGFFSQVAQVVILREALTAFAGVEMVLGLMLAVWLLAVGVGGFAGNRIGIFRRRSYGALGVLYVLAGLLLPVSIIALRQLPVFFDFFPGEIVGPGFSLLGALLTVSPVCFLLGLLFTANARLSPTGSKKWVGQVYLLEAAGAAVGGLVVTFVLIPFYSHLAASVGMFLLAVAIFLLLIKRIRLRYLPFCGLIIVLWFGYGARIFSLAQFDKSTRSINRVAGDLLAVADSPHGQLAVTSYVDQYSLYVNGTLTSSYPHRIAAEEAVHFALLSHAAPRSALLIGGGLGGAVGEMLKHGVKLDYIELDPRLVELAKEHFPAAAVAPLKDCRVVAQDGRAFLSQTDVRYDVIILNLGEPSTAMINRYFTRGFFMTVKDHLTPGGIFSFRVPSAESYISPERGLFLSTLYKTLTDVFAGVVVLPGTTNIFIAADMPEGNLIKRPEQFIARLHSRNLHNEYVNEFILPFRLTNDGFDYLHQHLHLPEAKLNTDLQPVCYFYNAILWSRQFTGWQKEFYSELARMPPVVFPALILVLFLLVAGWSRFVGKGTTIPFLYSLAISGMTAMSMAVVLLYAFQVYLGFIYAKIGLLVACFMVGMSLGSFLLNRRAGVSPRLLVWGHCTPSLMAAGFLSWAVTLSAGGISSGVTEIIFYLFSTIFGAIGGALFVVANRLYMLRFHHGPAPVGTGYAVDLAGSAVGALVVSSLLIPVWGVSYTIWLIAALNLAAVLIVMLCGRGRNG